MVTRKICVASVVVVIGIELLIGSILLFALGGDLVQSNVKKVQGTSFSISFGNLYVSNRQGMRITHRNEDI